MNFSFFGRFLGAVLLLVPLALKALSPVPYTEGVGYSFTLSSSGSATMTVNGEGTSAVFHDNPATESSMGLAWLRPGHQYTVNVTGSGTTGFTMSFVAPTGYQTVIQSDARDLYYQATSGSTFNYSYTLELRPTGGSGRSDFGSFSGMNLGRSLTWSVGLGSLASERSAGQLFFKEKDFSSTSPGARARLYVYVPPNGGQIRVFKDGSSAQQIRQIIVPAGIVDLQDVSETEYNIRFFQLWQVTEGFPDSPCTLGGSPWKTINVKSTGANLLTITETEDGFSRVSEFSATVTDADNYTWTVKEGSAASKLRTLRHVGSRGAGASYREVLESVYTGDLGTVVGKTKYRYENPGWGEELVKMTADPDGAALETTYAYHTDSASRGNYRRLRSATTPSGGWSAQVYYDDWEKRGQLKYTFQPWLSAPSTVPTTLDASAEGRVTYYEYVADWTGRHSRPSLRTETTKVGTAAAIETGRTEWTHGDVVGYGWPREWSITNDWSSYHGADRISKYERNREDCYPGLEGLPAVSWGPDQTQASFSEISGTYSAGAGSFATSGNSHIRKIRVNGTTSSEDNANFDGSWTGTGGNQTFAPLYLLANKSTLTASIVDMAGLVLRTETWVYTPTGINNFTLLTWENYTYDHAGRLTRREASNGAIVENTYGGGLLVETKDSAGVITKFAYDDLGRVKASWKVGVVTGIASVLPGGYNYMSQPDVHSHYVYDGANRVRQSIQSTSAAMPTFPGGTSDLSGSADYDLAGRRVQSVAYAGAGSNSQTSTWDYSLGPRKVREIAPGGAEKISEWHRDGQLLSVSGSGVVSENYTYSIGWGGTRVVEATAGDTTAASTTTTTFNWLGQKTKVSKPSWNNGSPAVWQWVYNSYGQLWKYQQPGMANTLYLYDTLGRQIREGLDLGGDDQLDPGSDDRITGRLLQINTWDNGATWWAQTYNYTFASSGSTTHTSTSSTYERLRGGFPANVQREVVSYDINGNGTHVQVVVDRGNRLVQTQTTVPGSTTVDCKNVFNGLLVESRSSTGVLTTYQYDAHGRQTKVIDPRTAGVGTGAPFGQRMTYVDGTNLPHEVIDAANKTQAVYDYDAAGRIKRVQDAAGELTYFSYNSRGQKIRQWGSASYPVEYAYDELGRQITQKTYRGGSNWTGSTWSTLPGAADWTRWNYDASSGLLKEKYDAANLDPDTGLAVANAQKVAFTYNQAGQLKTRTWARGVTTTYHYFGEGTGEPKTGELRKVDYGDATPDVEYTYDRLGRTTEVHDYTGTRQFTYNSANLALESEILGHSASDFYSVMRIFRGYEGSGGVVGRYNRLSVGSTTTLYYDTSYGYDAATGRLNRVLDFNYTYEAGSNLIKKIDETSSSWTQTRTYDERRDLIDTIETKWSTTPKAKFDYEPDDLGRAQSVTKTGELFASYGTSTKGLKTTFGYNARSEVTAESTADLSTPALPLVGRQEGYIYDNLGNRASTNGVTHNGNGAGYTTNALNQYTQRVVPGILDVAGAAASGSSVLTAGVTPSRNGEYFFRNFIPGNSSSPNYGELLVGTTPKAKSLGGLVSFNWSGKSFVAVAVTNGPTGAPETVTELRDQPYHVGINAADHGYTFQNGKTYTFGYWARTLGGTRTVTLMLTDHDFTGTTASATFVIGTEWKWVSVTKTYTAVGANPRCYYTADGGGQGTFQIFGAQVTEVAVQDGGYSLPLFLAKTPEAFAYDADGNLTRDGRWVYQYDAENRLIAMFTRGAADDPQTTDGDASNDAANAAVWQSGVARQKLQFAYDYLGRRVYKLVSRRNAADTAWEPAPATKFLFDGWNLLWECDGSMSIKRAHLWGLDQSGTMQGAGGVGGLLVTWNFPPGLNPEVTHPVMDALGNVHGATDYFTGTIVAAYEYDAFGQTLRESGPAAAGNAFRFSTKYTDIETGLVYYGLRYYTPTLGRFINRDPIEEQGGMNLYAFCFNNAINKWDNLGLDVDPPEGYGSMDDYLNSTEYLNQLYSTQQTEGGWNDVYWGYYADAGRDPLSLGAWRSIEQSAVNQTYQRREFADQLLAGEIAAAGRDVAVLQEAQRRLDAGQSVTVRDANGTLITFTASGAPGGPNSGVFAAANSVTNDPGSPALGAGGSRSLTSGEIALAKSIFGSQINYDDVSILRKKYAFFQPKDVVMTPNGNIYFNPKGNDYRDDFSKTNDIDLRALFVHELVHVWQHQQGVNVLLRGMTERQYDYLPLTPGRSFTSYNIEQQGDIVRDYYYLRSGSTIPGVSNPPPLSTYQNLIPFLPPAGPKP